MSDTSLKSVPNFSIDLFILILFNAKSNCVVLPPNAFVSRINVSSFVSCASCIKLENTSAAFCIAPDILITIGARLSPNASAASPAAFCICSNLPPKLSASDCACPANCSAINFIPSPAFNASGVNSLNAGPSFSPSSPAIPLKVFDVFITADSSVIPVAAAKSTDADIVSFICCSDKSKLARYACCAIIASSPNLVFFCNACAWLIKASVISPAANLNFFSASSCCANKSIDVLTALNKACDPK